MAVRAIAERLAGRGASRITPGQFLDSAPVPVIASEANRAVIAAGVLQPWKLRGAQASPALERGRCASVPAAEMAEDGSTRQHLPYALGWASPRYRLRP